MSFTERTVYRDRYFPADLPTDTQLNEALQRAGIMHCFGVPYPWAPNYDAATHRTFNVWGAFEEEWQTRRNARRA